MADDTRTLKDELAQLLVEYKPLKQEMDTLISTTLHGDADEYIRVHKQTRDCVKKYRAASNRIFAITKILLDDYTGSWRSTY
jgi:hypothetical protein